MNDHATLARIEDHLRRQAEATERIAEALETRPQLHACICGEPHDEPHWVTRGADRYAPEPPPDRSWPTEEDVQYPTTIREAIDAEQARKIDAPVVDLMAALKASVEAAKNRPEAVSRASIEPDPVTEAENGATD